MAGPFYVDDTATGGADTGADWANAYLTFQQAMDDVTLAAGDFIYVANTHTEGAAATDTWNIPSSSENAPVIVISTDDTTNTPPQTFASGAELFVAPGATGAPDLVVGPASGEAVVFIGCEVVCPDNLWLSGTQGAVVIEDGVVGWQDLTLGQSSTVVLRNSLLCPNVATADITTGSRHGKLTLIDCALHPSAAVITSLFVNAGTGVGGETIIDGLDLSGASTSAFELIKDADIDKGQIRGSGILMPANGTIYDGAMQPGGLIDLRSISSTGSSIMGVYFKNTAGSVTEETTTVLDATYDGTNKYSLCFEPIAQSIVGAPGHHSLRYPISELWCDADATIDVHITSDTASLDASKVWLEIEHPDPTNAVLRKLASTIDAHYMLDPTPTALSTESDPGWTSGKTNFYKLSKLLDSSAGVVKVFVCVASGATTPVLYVDPAVDVS